MKEIPLLLFNRFNESKKNLICKDNIIKTSNQFFSLDIDQIEFSLNERRKYLLAQWSNKGFHNKIIYKNKEIEYTYDKGLCELAKDFKLYQPKNIDINIISGFHKNPAELIFSSGSGCGEFDIDHCYYRFEKVSINVYIDILDLENDVLVWTDRNPYYFTEILYHELLHACGDIICDGIIRHNLVGIDVIKELIK